MDEIKPCHVCGSKNLKKYAPDLWEYDEDGYRPLICYKRIECKDCGATVPLLCMTIENTIKDRETYARYVLQKIME